MLHGAPGDAMDWDNLRYFLELARAGTLVGAARRLAVDHTTVARRLQALEKQVGSALFAREAGGHRLTEAGRQLLPVVEAMESAVMGAERAAPASHEGPSGLVRVGATEGFGSLILAPHLAQLTRKHPHLSIDLLVWCLKNRWNYFDRCWSNQLPYRRLR